MSKIIKVQSTEELLKIYFFKLYSKKQYIRHFSFDEQKIHSLIVSNSYKEIESSKLFNCITVYDDEMQCKFFEYFSIPSHFYYFSDHIVLDVSIENHPFLYEEIGFLEGVSLFVAKSGERNIDILSKNGRVLKNIYIENTSYEIDTLSDELFYIIDEFRRDDAFNLKNFSLYSYKKNSLEEVHQIENKSQILDIINNKKIPIIFSKASVDLRKDKEVAFAAINQDKYCIRYLDKSLYNDNNFLSSILAIDGFELFYANENQKNDKEIVLAAVTNYPHSLQYANEELKNDKEIVFAAVANEGSTLQYASDLLKNDKEIVLAALANQPSALQYASDVLKNDKEIVLAAVANKGTSLQYASEELKTNKAIVLAAIKNNGFAFEYASKELRNNKEFVLLSVITNAFALQYASEELKNDKEIVLAAVTQNGWSLEYASDELKNNKEIVLAAIKNRKGSIKYSSQDIKSDREFLIKNYDSIVDDDLPF